ncbi:MAG: TolC family protein, partial [Methylophilus sp.]
MTKPELNFMLLAKHLVLVAGSLALTACINLAPFFSPPEAPVPATLGTVTTDQKPLTEVSWQSFITDKRLQQVVDISLKNNRDLQVASLNIEKARAQYQVQRADLFPTVAATLSETASKGMSNVGNNGNVSAGTVAASNNSSGNVSHVYR